MTRIAILDYGMGNLRSVEKAIQRVGRRPRSPATMTAPGRPTGWSCPGSVPFPGR
jgi:imidazoleglycerol phosphate synthase glutamine amidotransferase subunit HisH